MRKEIEVEGKKLVVDYDGVMPRCKARRVKLASVFIPIELFDSVIVFRRGYNAQQIASISGPAVVWSYSDEHGMELVAVLKRGEEFEYWLPGHHGHGPGMKFRGRVLPDGTVKEVRLPTARRLQL